MAVVSEGTGSKLPVPSLLRKTQALNYMFISIWNLRFLTCQEVPWYDYYVQKEQPGNQTDPGTWREA